MSELQLSQRVKDLELTIRRLEAESSSQSEALGDSCSDAMESDFVRDLMADYVSYRYNRDLYFIKLASHLSLTISCLFALP